MLRVLLPTPICAAALPGGWIPGRNRPTVADVLLIIEVADSSLSRDLDEKSLAYAQAGVPELWVVDIRGRRIHRLTRPSPEGYQEQTIAGEDEIITPNLIPNLQMPVREAL